MRKTLTLFYLVINAFCDFKSKSKPGFIHDLNVCERSLISDKNKLFIARFRQIEWNCLLTNFLRFCF